MWDASFELKAKALLWNSIEQHSPDLVLSHTAYPASRRPDETMASAISLITPSEMSHLVELQGVKFHGLGHLRVQEHLPMMYTDARLPPSE